MLGGRFRQGLSGPRPTGRYVLIGVGIVVLCVVLAEVFYQVANSSGSYAKRSASSWAGAITPTLACSGALAVELHDVRQLADVANRLSLTNLLGELDNASEQCLASSRALRLRAPSARLSALATDVLTDRLTGVNELRSSISALTTPGLSAALKADGVQELDLAGTEFVSADRELKHLAKTDPAVLGTENWVSTPSAWAAPSLLQYANELEHAPAYQLRHGLRLVALSLEPAPLRITGLPSTTTTSTTTTTTSTLVLAHGPSGVALAPPSTVAKRHVSVRVGPTPTTLQIPPISAVAVMGPITSLRAIVVLANTGNVTEATIGISAQLVALDAKAGVSSSIGSPATAIVKALQPNVSRYVLLPSIALDPKVSNYRLLVTISDPTIPALHAAVTLRSGS